MFLWAKPSNGVSKPDMSRNAHNLMHGNFNKRHKLSRHPSCKLNHHFWQDIRTIKVIKCPSNYNPWRDINSNPNPSLTDNPNTTLTLKLQRGGLRLDLAGHFVTFSKIERASNYVHVWT